MRPNFSLPPTVVADIRSDGTYMRSLREYVRDFIISDGGSYDFANLCNQFGNEIENRDDSVLVIIVPSQTVMEKASHSGRIVKSAFDLRGDKSKLEALHDIFSLSGGSLDASWRTLPPSDETITDVTVKNRLNYPIVIELDFGQSLFVSVTDITTGVKLKVSKFVRREYQSKVIYFVYLPGILLTTELAKFILA